MPHAWLLRWKHSKATIINWKWADNFRKFEHVAATKNYNFWNPKWDQKGDPVLGPGFITHIRNKQGTNSGGPNLGSKKRPRNGPRSRSFFHQKYESKFSKYKNLAANLPPGILLEQEIEYMAEATLGGHMKSTKNRIQYGTQKRTSRSPIKPKLRTPLTRAAGTTQSNGKQALTHEEADNTRSLQCPTVNVDYM
jgi:hypothetical protein